MKRKNRRRLTRDQEAAGHFGPSSFVVAQLTLENYSLCIILLFCDTHDENETSLLYIYTVGAAYKTRFGMGTK